MLLLLFLLALTPQQAAIRALADADLRVATVGDRLARGGAALCSGQATSLGGLVIQDARQYSGAMRDDARTVLKLGKGPTVVGGVTVGAPIAPGADIVAVDGQPVIVGGGPYADVERAEALIEAGLTHGKATLTLSDGRTLALPAQAGCRSRFQIVRGGLGKTQADGRYVQLSDSMLAFARTDDEVASVLAHELAHNVLSHQSKKTPSKQAEYEADWLSVWLVARAGYDVDAIIPFWTRLGKRTDFGIFSDGTHPGWKRRVAQLSVAVATVKEQRARGMDIVPTPAQQSASQAQNPR